MKSFPNNTSPAWFLSTFPSTCEAQNQLFATGFGNYGGGQLPKEEFEEWSHSGDISLMLQVHALSTVPPLPQLSGPWYWATQTEQTSVVHSWDKETSTFSRMYMQVMLE